MEPFQSSCEIKAGPPGEGRAGSRVLRMSDGRLMEE